jgi:hypothetical protein
MAFCSIGEQFDTDFIDTFIVALAAKKDHLLESGRYTIVPNEFETYKNTSTKPYVRIALNDYAFIILSKKKCRVIYKGFMVFGTFTET